MLSTLSGRKEFNIELEVSIFKDFVLVCLIFYSFFLS